jgi:hypothetical protein
MAATSSSNKREEDTREKEREQKQKQIERKNRRRFSDLPLEWWQRSPGCKEAKIQHMARVDRIMDGVGETEAEIKDGRERLVMLTTLWQEDIVLEPNMFPCELLPDLLACLFLDFLTTLLVAFSHSLYLSKLLIR